MTNAPEVVDRVWDRARDIGVEGWFRPSVRHTIGDDHIPLLEAGIRAIDVIDFDYPHWHTLQDTVDKTSAESLDIVGEVAMALVCSRYSSEISANSSVSAATHTAAARDSGGNSGTRSRCGRRAAWGALLPLALIVGVGYVGTVLWTVRTSLSSSRTFPRDDFVGLQQFERLLESDRWMHAIHNLAVYGVLYIVAAMLLAGAWLHQAARRADGGAGR